MAVAGRAPFCARPTPKGDHPPPYRTGSTIVAVAGRAPFCACSTRAQRTRSRAAVQDRNTIVAVAGRAPF